MGKNTPKMSNLVVNAIKNLRDVQGSTKKEILNYIMSQQSASEPSLQRQMYAALKRGLEYGILKRDQGYYSLNTNCFDTLPGGQSTIDVKNRGRQTNRRTGRRRKTMRRRTGRSRSRRRARRRGNSRNVRFARKKTKKPDELNNATVDSPALSSPGPAEPQNNEGEKEFAYNHFNDQTNGNRPKSRERSATRSRSSASTDGENADDRPDS